MIRKQLSSILFVLAVLAIGFFLGVRTDRFAAVSKTETGNISATSTLSLMLDYSDGKIAVFKENTSSKEPLFETMKRLLQKNNIPLTFKEYPGLGVLIESIGSRQNGSEKKYWQYWVNNEYAKVGADSYLPKTGDIIEWKFIKQQSL